MFISSCLSANFPKSSDCGLDASSASDRTSEQTFLRACFEVLPRHKNKTPRTKYHKPSGARNYARCHMYTPCNSILEQSCSHICLTWLSRVFQVASAAMSAQRSSARSHTVNCTVKIDAWSLSRTALDCLLALFSAQYWPMRRVGLCR